MITSKQYSCEIPDCGRSVQIRSTIKTGEFKGKKCCSICKQKIEGKQKIQKPIVKSTKKNVERRREERKGLPEFFATAISLLKLNPYCQNCGGKIKTCFMPHHNVAHLVSKSHYKSVMINPHNFVFLCAGKDNTGLDCHYDFDNKVTERPFMPVFDVVMVKYRLFKDDVLEQGKEREIFENYL